MPDAVRSSDNFHQNQKYKSIIFSGIISIDSIEN